MRSGKTRQSHTTCSHRHSGKIWDAMQGVAEVPAPVVVRPVRVVNVEVRVKVILVAVEAIQADKVSRAVAIVLQGQTTRQRALSQTR